MGLLIGLIGLVLFALLGYNSAKDYTEFSKRQHPTMLDVGNLEPEDLSARGWVTITNSRLDCTIVEKTPRMDVLERLILGPVSDTYTIADNQSGIPLMIVQIHGDVSCPDYPTGPLTGVLTSTDDPSYGIPYSRTELSKLEDLHVILHVGEGIRSSQVLLILAIVFGVGSLYLVLSSSRLWLANWESRSSNTWFAMPPNRRDLGRRRRLERDRVGSRRSLRLP